MEVQNDKSGPDKNHRMFETDSTQDTPYAKFRMKRRGKSQQLHQKSIHDSSDASIKATRDACCSHQAEKNPVSVHVHVRTLNARKMLIPFQSNSL